MWSQIAQRCREKIRVKNKEKMRFLSSIITMFFHVATRKTNVICKISTFIEELSFLNSGLTLILRQD